MQVALESLRGDDSQLALCREHNLSSDLVSRCQKLMEQAREVFAAPVSRSVEQARIVELERLVGQLTLNWQRQKLSTLLNPRLSKSER